MLQAGHTRGKAFPAPFLAYLSIECPVATLRHTVY